MKWRKYLELFHFLTAFLLDLMELMNDIDIPKVFTLTYHRCSLCRGSKGLSHCKRGMSWLSNKTDLVFVRSNLSIEVFMVKLHVELDTVLHKSSCCCSLYSFVQLAYIYLFLFTTNMLNSGGKLALLCRFFTKLRVNKKKSVFIITSSGIIPLTALLT